MADSGLLRCLRTPGAPGLVTLTLLCLGALLLGLSMGVRGESLRGLQEQAECDVPSHGGLVIQTIQSIAGEDRILYFKTPTIRCPDGVRIRADSAVMYESTNYNNLIGNVLFEDQDSRLSAEQAQYFSNQRRLTASGNPVLTDLTDGSVIRGDRMVMVRAGPNQPEDNLTVSGRRPHATLYPKPQPAPERADTVAPSDTLVGPGIPAASPDSVPPEELPEAAEPAERTRVQRPGEESRVPYEIDASRFVLEGSRFFRATGSVVVTRDSLRAEADSLEYDQDEGALFLSEGASVTTAQTDLAANTIRLGIPQDEVREALATGEAVLEGEELRLLAPIITLFFGEGQVERLVAVRDAVADSVYAELTEEEREAREEEAGLPPVAVQEVGLSSFPRRPYALAQDFLLIGDSVDVHVPGEVLREVRAVGSARGESTGRDSLNAPDTPGLISRDWLEGDTIVAYFQEAADSAEAVEAASPPVPASEATPPPVSANEIVQEDSTGAEYQLQQLVAVGGARSMYRMAASDSTMAEEPGRFAVHYVVGDRITIRLNENGEAETMEVEGQTRGIHLEPIHQAETPPDTVAPPDTSQVRRSGGGTSGGRWHPRPQGSERKGG